MKWLSVICLTVCAMLVIPHSASATTDLLNAMQAELDRSMTNLGKASVAPMYYLQYAVTEQHEYSQECINGGMMNPSKNNRCYLDVDLRVGSMNLDNTHLIRGGDWSDNWSRRRITDFPYEADSVAVRAALWSETEYQYRQAQERITKIETNRQVKVQEQDLSDDFSAFPAQQYSEQVSRTVIDTAYWQSTLKHVGSFFAGYPFIQESTVRLAATDQTIYMVNSEGSRLHYGNHYIRLTLIITATAKDGMELMRRFGWDAATLDKLPNETTMLKDAQRLVDELQALIDAPIVEPYIGPAILNNRASGVFFHEIFGHRIEGHRQKNEEEGQTFTKKVGELILPDFINVYDDPTRAQFKGTDLRGYYKFDDEGTPAQRVSVVEKGVLKNFLMSRSPIDKFNVSNGHGRRQYGNDIVSRQGNLTIQSEKSVPYPELRKLLIAECKKQNKPYGLVFDDISGGFTMTGRGGPQAFKVQPLYVRRVYADGRPDEVIRGVDVVGTPLTSFSKIIMAADDDDVFNGTCGAESGMVPVSAVSPSILVSEIEVEKKEKGQEKPPILAPPENKDNK